MRFSTILQALTCGALIGVSDIDIIKHTLIYVISTFRKSMHTKQLTDTKIFIQSGPIREQTKSSTESNAITAKVRIWWWILSLVKLILQPSAGTIGEQAELVSVHLSKELSRLASLLTLRPRWRSGLVLLRACSTQALQVMAKTTYQEALQP